MWNIAYTVTSVGFVLGLSLCARILHITLSDNRHHLLGKPFREWPLQLKIRMCSIVSVLVIEFTYVGN